MSEFDFIIQQVASGSRLCADAANLCNVQVDWHDAPDTMKANILIHSKRMFATKLKF
jgi:hypothetical protein